MATFGGENTYYTKSYFVMISFSQGTDTRGKFLSFDFCVSLFFFNICILYDDIAGIVLLIQKEIQNEQPKTCFFLKTHYLGKKLFTPSPQVQTIGPPLSLFQSKKILFFIKSMGNSAILLCALNTREKIGLLKIYKIFSNFSGLYPISNELQELMNSLRTTFIYLLCCWHHRSIVYHIIHVNNCLWRLLGKYS